VESAIDKKSVRKNIYHIASPVLVELLLGTLFGMVDMIMLGRSGSTDLTTASIAAVGITNQLVFVGLSLVQALNVGATAMVARYIGAGKDDRIETVVKHTILLTQVFIVLPVLYLGLFKSLWVMQSLGAGNDTISIGMGYFRVVILGFIFQGFNFSLFASLRGAGDTRAPMKINVIVNLFNVFGNAILIFGLLGFPALGVTGAGISTALSQVVASVMLLRYLSKSKGVIKLNLKHRFSVDGDTIYNLVKIGVPASLEQIAFRGGILIFTRMVASLGTIAYATHQICIGIMTLSFTPGQAFGTAASTLTGRSLGAQEPELAELYIRENRRIGAVISAAMGLLFFFLGPYVAMMYTDSAEVINEAAKVLKLMAFIMPFQGSQLIVAGGLRGAGDTVWTLIATFAGTIGVRIVLAWLFVIELGYGLLGAWMAVFVDQFVRWAFITLRFNTNRWKYISIK
jgi:putative MATE family efflux protein